MILLWHLIPFCCHVMSIRNVVSSMAIVRGFFFCMNFCMQNFVGLVVLGISILLSAVCHCETPKIAVQNIVQPGDCFSPILVGQIWVKIWLDVWTRKFDDLELVHVKFESICPFLFVLGEGLCPISAHFQPQHHEQQQQ